MDNQSASVQLPLLTVDQLAEFQKERNIIIADEISDDLALRVMILLRSFDMQSNKPINIYLNSPGGSVSAGLTIIDNMRLIKSPIHTICYGMAASMAAVIFACGEKGHRYVLPHAEIMIHQPWSGGGRTMKQTEAEIFYKHLTRTREITEALLAENSNITIEEMHIACEQDNYLTAAEAVKMGLADEILNAD